MRFKEIVDIGKRLQKSTIVDLTQEELFRFIQKATNTLNKETIKRNAMILKQEGVIQFYDGRWKIIREELTPTKEEPIKDIAELEEKIDEIKQAKQISPFEKQKNKEKEEERIKKRKDARILVEIEVQRLIENTVKEKQESIREVLDKQNKIIYKGEIICERCLFDMTGAIWEGYKKSNNKINQEDVAYALNQKFCEACGKLFISGEIKNG